MQLLTTKTNAQKTISTNHSESNHKEPQKMDSNMQKYMQNEIIEFLQNQWNLYSLSFGTFQFNLSFD